METRKLYTYLGMRKIILSSVFCLSLFFPFFFLNFLIAPIPISAETITVSATVGGAVVSPSPETSSGGINLPHTSVQFSGEAYPSATVVIFKNGQIIATTNGDGNGFFSVTIEEKYDSTALYGLYARDLANNKSLLLNYPLVIYSGYLTHISGIRFAPTVALDKIQVSVGDYLTVAGYALPKKELQIAIEDKNKKSTMFTLNARDTGRYNITLPLMNFSKGNYFTYVKYTDDIRISKLVEFLIGDTNIKSTDVTLNIPGDCNADGAINLTDFSVLAFWYKKQNPPVCVDINKDNIVDLIDFSILAYYWNA